MFRPVGTSLATVSLTVALLAGCAAATPTGLGPTGSTAPTDATGPAGTGAANGAPSTDQVLALAGSVLAGHRPQLDRLGATVTTAPHVLSTPIVRPDATALVRVGWGYRITGFDTVDRAVITELTLAPSAATATGGPWRLVREDDTVDRLPLYALPGFAVATGAQVLVVGTVDAARLDTLRDQAVAVRATVARWWPEVPPVVVVAPATQDQATALMVRGSAPAENLAAVTDGPIPAGADAVILDPAGFDQLTEVGRSVVLTHEVSHVAVRASCPGGCLSVPIWLREGYAELVGFSAAPPGQDDRRTIAATLLARLRSGAWTPAVPEDAAFSGDATTTDSAYLASWLLLARLDDRYGADAVRRFYLAAAQIGPDRAFEQVLGTTRDAVVTDWVGYVRSLLV